MRWSLPPRVAITAVLALALVGGGIALRSAASATGAPVDLSEPRATSTADAAGTGQPAAADAASATEPATEPATGQQDTSPDLVVHVVGQVATPGIVRLPAGARVVDAIEAAGGALPTADLSTLNLAAEVVDGAQVRVPAPGEGVEPAQTGAATTEDGTGTTTGSGLVDVNRADATRLQDLPGVGPVLAERIVADREDNGPFSSVDDLQRVTGIGPAVLAGLRDQATA